jgi:hypothetical protein
VASSVKTTPITWTVQRLMCDCGGEFVAMFTHKYSDTPYMHVCNKCNATENTEYSYPKTVWGEV